MFERLKKTVLKMKTTAQLEDTVEEELNIPDPTPEIAKALLDEATDEHDGAGSSSSDREDSE
jgi:hypothetical protein